MRASGGISEAYIKANMAKESSMKFVCPVCGYVDEFDGGG